MYRNLSINIFDKKTFVYFCNIIWDTKKKNKIEV